MGFKEILPTESNIKNYNKDFMNYEGILNVSI